MRKALFAIVFLSLLPLLPLAAQEPQPVRPSSEVEPGKEAPDWEARFKKEKGKEHADEKRDQRKEMKKDKKKDDKDEKRDQKRERHRERRHDGPEHH